MFFLNDLALRRLKIGNRGPFLRRLRQQQTCTNKISFNFSLLLLRFCFITLLSRSKILFLTANFPLYFSLRAKVLESVEVSPCAALKQLHLTPPTPEGTLFSICEFSSNKPSSLRGFQLNCEQLFRVSPSAHIHRRIFQTQLSFRARRGEKRNVEDTKFPNSLGSV